MKNLFLIQQKQETDEQCEKKEKELEEVKSKYFEQEDRCKRQMDEIQQTVEATELEIRHLMFLDQEEEERQMADTIDGIKK